MNSYELVEEYVEKSTEDFEATSWSGSNIDSEDESPDHGHSPDNINFFSADLDITTRTLVLTLR